MSIINNTNNSIFQDIWQFFKANSMFCYIWLIIIAGFCTYVINYQNPRSLYWDENYHVSSAYRYLDGKLFMEPHPPLGKLIVALGEKVTGSNKNLTADEIKAVVEGDAKDDGIPHIATVPENFSFVGVRFFPVMAAWLAGPLLFYFLWRLLRNEHLAFFFTLPYIFDNALVVHNRGAMLDSIQLFFMFGALSWFINIWRKSQIKISDYIILGLIIGLNVATKVNGAILFILPIALFIRDIYSWEEKPKNSLLRNLTILFFSGFILYFLNQAFTPTLVSNFKNPEESANIIGLIKLGIGGGVLYFLHRLVNKVLPTDNTLEYTDTWFILHKFGDWMVRILVVIFSAGFVFLGSYYLHFSIANQVLPSNSFGGYTSQEHKKILENGGAGNILNFATQLKDHLNFTKKFQDGVPKLDLTKGDGENGSHPLTWALGDKSIRYSAAKGGTNCSKDQGYDGCKFSYLYIIPNIFVWGLALVGVLLAIAMLVAKFLFNAPIKMNEDLGLTAMFAGMYAIYMLAMFGIERVMYLYHYFLPLIFGLICASLVTKQYFENKPAKLMYTFLGLLSLVIILNFIYFSPFTYKTDITAGEFVAHDWFKFWGLKMDW